ncbi:DUF3108 domain-containing protein [Elizabethkingia miricola]|uniref:DUF3108 domain-containing protein n=2 Tax=Weeksellaceae TaxID=2762318 RepID=UPI00293D0D43|nr:hypothetical protein [Elizabethkingia miricola]MDV3462927.1 hypothetical protein [Elizabethkingia anophelis]WQM38100.1 hypothetical protein U2S95_17245 [Elizabethkingia miricola]
MKTLKKKSFRVLLSKINMKKLILLLLLTSVKISAQTLITPSNVKLCQKAIHNETYTMKWFAKQGEQKIEIADVSTEVTKNKNEILIVTSVKMKMASDPWTDSTKVRRESFSPLYHSSFNRQRDMILKFSKKVKGYYLDKSSKIKSLIYQDNKGNFFDSNVYPYLIRFLPLKENYTATIPIFDYKPTNKKQLLNAYIKNTNVGKLLNKEVFIVTVSDEISGEFSTSTYYIDYNTRQLLKQEINANGRQMTMELVL